MIGSYHFPKTPVSGGSMENKKYEELKLSDDFMFGKVMKDDGVCKDVLECLLQHSVGKLEPIVSQKEFKHTINGKPIKLDIYTRDSKRIYDAEMQNKNRHSIEYLDLPKRSRFYQSMIDTDFLDKGFGYRELLESEIVFICTFDPFEKGCYKYSFTEMCDEVADLRLKDGTVRYFFNCAYEGDDIPKEIRNLYMYIQREEVCDELTARIDQAIREARLVEEWRSEYMKELLRDYDSRQEGRIEQKEIDDAIIEEQKTIIDELKEKVAELEGKLKAEYIGVEKH